MYNQSSIQYLTIITRSWKSILTFDVFYFFDDIQWAGSSGSSSLANHYRLRPIESGQFRFYNFAPNFEGKCHFHFLIH